MNKAMKYFKYALIMGLVFGLFFGIGAGVTSMFSSSANLALEDGKENEEGLTRQDGKLTNILVLGVDARPGETKSRSDTMMIVSIDPKLDKAAIISIPRDTKVEMPGTDNDKICVANVIGGPEYAVKIVEKLTSTKIDYYVELDFKGFKEVVDILGGVTVNVPERMYKPSEDINLYPGTKKLNGRDALAFVRYRDYVNGDIDRANMQQYFLKALAEEILQPKTITKLPKLVKQANSHITTNMGVTDMLRIASWAPGFTADSVTTQTLPGTFYDVRDANGVLVNSYWIADQGALKGLIDNMMQGKTVAVIQGLKQTKLPPVNNNDEDEDEDGEDLTAKERSKLPSPGHKDDKSSVGYIKSDKNEQDKIEAPEINLPKMEPDTSPDQAESNIDNYLGPEGYI